LLVLSANPEKQEKLHAELRAAMPDPNVPLTADILSNLTYLKACIRETTRYFFYYSFTLYMSKLGSSYINFFIPYPYIPLLIFIKKKKHKKKYSSLYNIEQYNYFNFRTNPVVTGNIRTTENEIVLSGYRIPKGVSLSLIF
jgi:hypothetical protein